MKITKTLANSPMPNQITTIGMKASAGIGRRKPKIGSRKLPARWW